MLNNNLILSLIVSSLSTLFIYMSTNRSQNTKESLYSNKDTTIIFSINIAVTYLFLHLRGKSKLVKEGGGGIQPLSTESIMSHSSRPPF